MASEGRRPNGFADALGDLGGDEWTTKAKPEKPRPDPAQLRETAELAGFESRRGAKPAVIAVPAPAASKTPRRQRHLTGRSEQVNVRATAAVKARFQAIAEKHFRSDADAFEKAVELLENISRS